MSPSAIYELPSKDHPYATFHVEGPPEVVGRAHWVIRAHLQSLTRSWNPEYPPIVERIEVDTGNPVWWSYIFYCPNLDDSRILATLTTFEALAKCLTTKETMP